MIVYTIPPLLAVVSYGLSLYRTPFKALWLVITLLNTLIAVVLVKAAQLSHDPVTGQAGIAIVTMLPTYFSAFCNEINAADHNVPTTIGRSRDRRRDRHIDLLADQCSTRLPRRLDSPSSHSLPGRRAYSTITQQDLRLD